MTTTEWRVGGFSEVRELGKGAQGRVVLARHDTAGTPVAIKYLARRAGDEEDIERLRGEAVMLARVADPHVVRLFRFVTSEHGAALVMEAVDGVSLRKILDEHRVLTAEAALVVLKGSLRGLAAAHAAGVVHRDYKPANVVVQADGLSKLIDFGVATSHGEESRAGTPAYMAPEQWEGQPAGPAADVYTATCVFFECVTGRRPYDTTDRVALMRGHLMDPVPAEAVPEPLRPLLLRGMAKRPEHRPPGAEAFASELEAAASATYGYDWEARGWAALSGAAVALAMLFPLAAAGLAPVAVSGAAVGAGAAAGSGSSAAGGGGLLAGVGAKVTVAVAGTAVVASAAGTAIYVTSNEKATPPARPVSLNIQNVSNKLTDLPLEIQGAQVATVTGLRDPALQNRVNQALREPYDLGVQAMRAMTNKQCKKSTTVTTRVRTGMRGPVLASVEYSNWGTYCVLADGGFPAAVVNVDLRTGKTLTAAEVFRPEVLTDRGARDLFNRLSGDKRDWTERCLTDPVGRKDFFKRTPTSEIPLTDIPHFKPFLTPGGLEMIWSLPGSACGLYVKLSAPYAKVRDLLKPELLPLVGG